MGGMLLTAMTLFSVNGLFIGTVLVTFSLINIIYLALGITTRWADKTPLLVDKHVAALWALPG